MVAISSFKYFQVLSRTIAYPVFVQTLLADSIWDSAKSWRKKSANSTNGCFPNCLAKPCPLKLQKHIVNKHEIGDLSWTWSWKTEEWQSVPCSTLATLCIHDLWLCHHRDLHFGDFPLPPLPCFIRKGQEFILTNHSAEPPTVPCLLKESTGWCR